MHPVLVLVTCDIGKSWKIWNGDHSSNLCDLSYITTAQSRLRVYITTKISINITKIAKQEKDQCACRDFVFAVVKLGMQATKIIYLNNTKI